MPSLNCGRLEIDDAGENKALLKEIFVEARQPAHEVTFDIIAASQLVGDIEIHAAKSLESSPECDTVEAVGLAVASGVRGKSGSTGGRLFVINQAAAE